MRQGERERVLALAQARTEIAGRIRGVCAHLDEEEFDLLVDRMARIDVRFRLRDDWGLLRESRFAEHN